MTRQRWQLLIIVPITFLTGLYFNDILSLTPRDAYTQTRGQGWMGEVEEIIKRDEVVNVTTNNITVGMKNGTNFTVRHMKIPDRYLIEESDYCTRQRHGLQMIAYVHTAISKVGNRQITRATWANATANGFFLNLGTVFVVGRAKNEHEAKIVWEESQRYRDIIQIDYDDDYKLLAYKGMSALYWINKHCSAVPWTLHSDDDTIVDVFCFARELNNLTDDKKDRFICNYMNGPVLRTGRWGVEKEEFPTRDYPNYCSGGAWVLPTKLIPRLIEATKEAPYVWVDDAYITGLLRVKAKIKQVDFTEIYSLYPLKTKQIGKKVAWLYPSVDRIKTWKEILEHHKNVSDPYFAATHVHLKV